MVDMLASSGNGDAAALRCDRLTPAQMRLDSERWRAGRERVNRYPVIGQQMIPVLMRHHRSSAQQRQPSVGRNGRERGNAKGTKTTMTVARAGMGRRNRCGRINRFSLSVRGANRTQYQHIGLGSRTGDRGHRRQQRCPHHGQ